MVIWEQRDNSITKVLKGIQTIEQWGNVRQLGCLIVQDKLVIEEGKYDIEQIL